MSINESRTEERLPADATAQALAHVKSAERLALEIPGLAPDTAIRHVQSVAVLGAGTMGGGIAMSFANAGFDVLLLDGNEAALAAGVERIRDNYAQSVLRGRLEQTAMNSRLQRIRPTVALADVAACDMVVEAVFESMPVKLDVFRQLDATCRPGAILCTNTSTLDVDEIAAATARPQDVVGLHFFSPANVMKLVEIVRGKHTSADVLRTAQDVSNRLQKISVVAGVCDGFIGNRMVAKYNAAVNRLIVEGAHPAEVDKALEAFGFPMGPCRMGDLAGLDIGWMIRKRRAAESNAPQERVIADALCEAGRFGQKTGAGWYRYEPKSRVPLPDEDAERIIGEFRLRSGSKGRSVSPDEIVDRAVLALVNEGARLLEEGIAIRASDIDVVYVHGYGFPASKGGPMYYADRLGASHVVASLSEIARQPGADASWRPAPLLERLLRSGETLIEAV